jgi:hypothetical protein
VEFVGSLPDEYLSPSERDAASPPSVPEVIAPAFCRARVQQLAFSRGWRCVQGKIDIEKKYN